MSRASRIRGHEYVEILERLADGQMSSREIAEEFDRHEGTINNFASDHRAEIDALRANHAAAITGIWIAKKELRLAEYRDKYDTFDEILGDMIEAAELPKENEDFKAMDVQLALKISAELRAIAKQAAEEQGDLMTRAPNSGPPPAGVKIVIEREQKTEEKNDGA